MLSRYISLHVLFQYTFWHSLVHVAVTSCNEEFDEIVVTKGGITYWSAELEHEYKRNYERISGLFRMDLENKFLKELNTGCGRMENRLGLLSDGSEICFRYRINLEQIQGEIYSYHLAKLLGIGNVLEPRLVLINESNSFWRQMNITDSSWENIKLVTATKFIKDTSPVRLPNVIVRQRFKVDLNISSFCGWDNETNFAIMMFLMQWSDMVIFDFLIGNFDRVVSNMFNMQWHSDSLMDPIDNLVQIKHGILLFIDNEEGFSHGYRLLDHYEQFHVKLIRNMCIFRRETLKMLEYLSQLSGNELHKELWLSIIKSKSEPQIFDYFMRMSEDNIDILKKRIDLVLKFVKSCKERSEA